MKSSLKRVYSPKQLASRVTSLGRDISRDYAGRTVDVVVMLENACVFSADLMRSISERVVCHFVRTEVRDIELGGHQRREIYFSRQPRLGGRDVLVIDAVVQSGLTQDFLLRRLEESRPRSLRLATLFDRPSERRVDLKPDYFCFVAASKYLAGYGLAGSRGWYRNLPYVGVQAGRTRTSGAIRRNRNTGRVR